MDMILKYFAGPLIAAALTTFFVWFKESKSEKNKHLQNVTYEQLTKVYNKLFILYYKYNSILEIKEVEEAYDVTPDGKELTRSVPSIEDFDPWNKVIKEVKEIVYPNIHLLMRRDVQLWNKFLEYELREPQGGREVIEPYQKFESFFKEITLSYIKLYNLYHLETKSVKKTRNKEYKKKLRNIKRNPFYSKDQKKKEITKLKKEEKETLKKII
ncbi:hypothetical protein [Sutcliffiella cohnii]|uniref:hypothetical protein n=1 Tax=Sutcliffiella cohnii TaxID=33932 RepID=UPI00082E2FAD|nr:hypothetical protein [Sutcliffiella cohnii]